MIDRLAPALIVPMHYLTPQINLPIQPVERLLEVLPDWPVDRVGGPEVLIDQDTLTQRRIIVLEPSR